MAQPMVPQPKAPHRTAGVQLWAAMAAAVFGVVGLLGACAPSPTITRTIAPPTTMPPIETKTELVTALEYATGNAVVPQGPAPPQFGVQGEALTVGGETVEVYAFPDSAGRATAQSEIDPNGPAFQGQPLVGWRNPRIWGVGRLLVVYDGNQGGTFLVLSGLLGDPMADAASAPGGDEPYPPAVSGAIVALAQAEGVDPGQVDVLSYEAAAWSDGCLGLPSEDGPCAAGEVQGWQVYLKVAGATFEVRTDDLGQRVVWRR